MTGASAKMPAAPKMANLFDQIDTSGSGVINQAQFTQAFQTMNPAAGFKAMGASQVFAALDPTNSGSVSRPAFVSGMTGLMAQFRSTNSSGA